MCCSGKMGVTFPGLHDILLCSFLSEALKVW